MSETLESFAEMIEPEYRRLGHTFGWRFLYSPARTLAPGTRLALVGLMPGSDVYREPILSVEEGNAFRIETWWPGRQGTGLQAQFNSCTTHWPREPRVPRRRSLWIRL